MKKKTVSVDAFAMMNVNIETSEYQITVRVRPRRVPMRSMSLPKTVCPIE